MNANTNLRNLPTVEEERMTSERIDEGISTQYSTSTLEIEIYTEKLDLLKADINNFDKNKKGNEHKRITSRLSHVLY